MGGGGQRSATLPTLSVSISSPTPLDEGSQQQYRGRKTSGNTLGALSPQSLTPTSASASGQGGAGGFGAGAPEQAAGQHVHTRSHSFTPKMPSKLATPTYPPQPTTASPTTTSFSFNRVPSPVSPPQQYQVFAGSTTSLLSNTNSTSKCGGEDGQSQQSHGGGNRKTGFFGGMIGGGEGGGRTTKLSSSPKTGAPLQQQRNVLSPPLIIEPKGHYNKRAEKEREDAEGMTDSRRSSQILVNSGFVNYLFTAPSVSTSHTSSSSPYSRLNVPQAHASSSSLNLHANQQHQQHLQQQLSNPKAWKPYKLDLKGSKLHFYKVPSDRASGVKDLFPSGLVVGSSASDEDEEAEGGGGGAGEGEHAHEAGPDSAVEGGDREAVLDGKASIGRKAKGKDEPTGGRRKRAYWGRGTHPDLILDAKGTVERGTWEALVHEAVFGSTFESEEREERYREFASSVVLALPGIVQRDTFEAEFVRCLGFYYVSPPTPAPSLPALNVDLEGTGGGDQVEGKQEIKEKEDGEGGQEKARITWLARTYLKYHGRPVDRDAWEGWVGEARIQEALLIADPPPPSSSPSQQQPLKPREKPRERQQSSSSRNQIPWHVLREEGLTRELMVQMDPYLVAKSLGVYFKGVIAEHGPKGGVRFEHLLSAYHSASGSASGHGGLASTREEEEEGREGDEDEEREVPDVLFGTEDTPNWLTKLVLLQLFEGSNASLNAPPSAVPSAGSGGPPSGGRKSEELLRSPPPQSHSPNPNSSSTNANAAASPSVTSRTHTRSSLLTLWIRIAQLARQQGDLCTWRAIMEGVTSRPVARLEKAWRRVEGNGEGIVRGWLVEVQRQREGEEGGRKGERESSMREEDEEATTTITPWGGDVKVRLKEELDKAKGDMLSVDGLKRVRRVFESFSTVYARCVSNGGEETAGAGNQDNDDNLNQLVSFWKDVAEGGRTSGMGVKFQRVEQFMALSIAAEPRRKGLFEPYFWQHHATATHPSSQTSPSSMFPSPSLNHNNLSPSPSGSGQAPYSALIPLLFPDALPTQTLVDRGAIVLPRGRANSDAAGQTLLGGPAGRRQLDFVHQDFTKKLILGQSGPVVSVYNGDLMLMVQPGALEGSSAPSRGPSRPTSSALDHQNNSTGSGTGATATAGGAGAGAGGVSGNMSRAPSIRVKPSTPNSMSRKTSMARRSSLPSVSHLQRAAQQPETSGTSNSSSSGLPPPLEVPPEHPPLRVIVQAGSLDQLVNVLVYGLGQVVVSVTDDNGEMALREGNLTTRCLVVDRGEYGRVWWSSFRSFVSPFVFFELLRKLYITSQPAGSSPPVEEYLSVATRRNQVLSTMREWIASGGGAQDLLDDTQLFNSVQAFLDSSTDHIVHKALAFEEPLVQQAWSNLGEGRAELRTCFVEQTKRPTLFDKVLTTHARGGANGGAGKGVRTRHTAPREPPDFDRMDPEEFVDNLDGMACAAFCNVTEEDLYITADLLEVQSSDKTGWFSTREPASTDEGTEIQCLYSHVQEVEPSSLIPEPSSQDVLYRLLPPGVRSCIRAFAIIRKWLISKIVAPRLGIRTRQARMELLVQCIEVARLRNAENLGSSSASTPSAASASGSPVLLQPCVRSFVEAVVTSALLSVESRMHQRAWQSVANSRACQPDSIASLLLRPYVQTTSSNDCLTVDVGWLLERMLEIIAGPDVLDSSSQEGQNLVNFDKRRHLTNLINKAWALPSTRKHPPSDEANRRGFERLNTIEKEVYHLHFDHRGIKEEAAREATQVGVNGPPSSKKTVRPFYKIVAVQLEKNRRDKNLRSRLQREKVMEQSRNERRDDMLNRAMKGPRGKHQQQQHHSQQQQSAGATPAPKQHRNKKSMSAFLNFMRPISSAFGAEFMSPSSAGAVKKTAAELDFVPSGKPAMVVSILDARVAQFINNERSYMFQLETEDGGHYLLQAMNKKDMSKWLETISKVTQSVAQRRLTYLGSSPKPQIADHIHDRAIVPSRDRMAVFGVELEFLLQREALGGDIASGTVPRIINECLTEIESRGLTEVGIYRIAGATRDINSLKEAFNRGESPITSSTDIHAVCDLVKSWFRVLPEPVFPPDSYYAVMDAMRTENFDEKLAGIRSVVQNLPQANFDLLRRVAEHLDRVTECEEHNHMTAEALAIVFSPNLLRAPQNNFAMILNNMGLSHKLVKAFITHFHLIFDESDPEVEAHSDDEYEPPIMEEDEDEEEEDNEPHYHQEGLQNNSSSLDSLPQAQYLSSDFYQQGAFAS
ncbi:hypothetical protein EST38_g130 [Candolleomyces aberdarensis]|uniref:Uncharacterized protein n=1 Tax=Candolleomyces aberdarensis TaxID=2316362 RepID=A0A4Q2E1P5_9AGAR|nr:hypothetical protein EST38_g130 [Candolleomyces aberdarensis]